MSPQLLAIIVSLVEEAVSITPQLVTDIQAIFSKPNPTPADWETLRAKVLSKSYADYVPASALPSANVVKLSTPIAAAAVISDAATPIATTPYNPDGSPNPDHKPKANA